MSARLYAGSVRRQVVGVVVLLLAGLLVVVIPALQPTVVTGVAAAAPIPGAPSVGDCVTEPIPYSMLWMGSGLAGGEYEYPALTIAPCDGPRYGEVAAVVPLASTPAVTISGPTTTVTDSNFDKCWRALAVYVGLAMTPAPPGTIWEPAIAAPSSISRPLPAARAAGQQWVACLAYVQASDQMPDRKVTPYVGTLRGAVFSGFQGDQLGFCGPAPDEILGGLCGMPHQFQLLGNGTFQALTVSRAELDRSCAEHAKMLMGRADATDGGNLKVVVTAFDSYGTLLAVGDVPAGGSASCGIASADDRLLGGSVVAVGEQPIPWV